MNHGLDNNHQIFFYEQDYYVLSNFSSFKLWWRGIHFDTSEQAYHWAKFTSSILIQSEIMQAESAYEAYRITRKHALSIPTDWHDRRVTVMREILFTKVEQHEYVKRKLLATGNRTLIENSWRDDFWGWGPDQCGENMLGKLWMEVREALR